MNNKQIESSYKVAKERYAALGIDTDKAIAQLEKTPISLHCWQADDVVGFERNEALSGGIQTTGNYPGRATNIDQLRQDIEEVISLLGGTFRLNLHETYGEFGGKFVDRDQVGPEHFTGWMQWAKDKGLKLDFNSTSFSHPKSGYLTLSNPDKEIRDFWIEHTKRCRHIADAMGKAQGNPCIMNIWIHDGLKDITVERYRYRQILKESLDDILSEKLPDMKTCLEAKLFGIGMEAYTVGSHDFYAGYCSKNNVLYTLDTCRSSCSTCPAPCTGTATMSPSLTTKRAISLPSSYVPMRWAAPTSDWTTSTPASIASEPISSAPAPHRRPCFRLYSSRWTSCASMRMKDSGLSGSPCSKNSRHCPSALSTTTSTSRTMFLWAKTTSRMSKSTKPTSPPSASNSPRSWIFSSVC